MESKTSSFPAILSQKKDNFFISKVQKEPLLDNNANSKFSASRLRKEYGIEGGVLYPVVDITEFNSNPSIDEKETIDRFRSEDIPYVVTVGNMSRFKGCFRGT